MVAEQMLYRCAREMSLSMNRTRKERRRPECLGGHEADDVCDANHEQPNHAVRGGVVGNAGRTAGEYP